MKPVALLVHVADVAEAVIWYQAAFPDAEYVESCDAGVEIIALREFQIEFVRSDTKVGAGRAGTVLYWSVRDLSDTVGRFEKLGAELYRGPIQIEHGLRMCQLLDPFGNLIGLRGV